MPKLRNLAPSWLQTALKRIDTPLTGGSDLTKWRPEGRNLIRKGWDQLYLDRIFAEGTLAQAKKDHDDRHARRLGDQAARAAVQAVAAGSSQTQAAAAAVAAMASVASGQADEYSGLSPEVQAVARVEGAWHTSFEPVVTQEVATKSGKTRRGANPRWCVGITGTEDSSDEDGDRRAAVAAARKRQPSGKQAQKSKIYDVDDPSTWKVSQLTEYLKGYKVASSGIKRTIIQRVIDHKAGLLRTRVVGEKRPREESGGVIEDGDVEAGSSADQGRGSEEGDTAAGGGEGDVGEEGEVLSHGFDYFDEDEDLSEDEDDEYADSDDSGDH